MKGLGAKEAQLEKLMELFKVFETVNVAPWITGNKPRRGKQCNPLLVQENQKHSRC